MTIEDRVKEIYEVEFNELIIKLKDLNKEQRSILYKEHIEKIFPKCKRKISLDQFLNENVKHNREKFRHCFLTIGCIFFNPYSNMGREYNKRRFMKSCGVSSANIPQTVMLAFSLMEFIKKRKSNYSSGCHGYYYELDWIKFFQRKEMDIWPAEPITHLENEHDTDDFFSDMVIVETDFSDKLFTAIEKDWLVEKQLNTISKINIDTKEYKRLMKEREDMVFDDSFIACHKKKELNNLNMLYRLYHKSKSAFHITIDGEEGRLYSVMTNLKSIWRKKILHIEGERLCEVDLSSLHPTLFALMILKEHSDIKSEWLNACLRGDFYKWCIETTNLTEFSPQQIINEMSNTVNGLRINKTASTKKCADKLIETISEIEYGLEINTTDVYALLKPVVKSWIMKLLFSHTKLSSTLKLRTNEKPSIYKIFCNRFLTYLKEQEPVFYETLDYYRTKENLNQSKKNPTKSVSKLPYELQKEEVRFIKECLKNIDNANIEYVYTIHDAVGSVASNGCKIKKIMEDTALKVYGVKLHLKLKVSEDYDPLGLDAA
ncbi:MAG: hypothetical protein J1F38_08750 [Muribaculaceae bacterium]|nr:hypothetical protein [Muribaculaceae bacterium]